MFVRRPARAALAVVLLAICACAAAAPDRLPSDPTVEATRTSTDFGVLSAVRVTLLAADDRIIFEFSGSLPGYRLSYAAGPRARAGRDAPTGAVSLEIVFEPASMVDGRSNTQPSGSEGLDRITVNRPDDEPGVLEQLILISDSNRVVTWAAELRERVPFTVRPSADPATLTVDLAHND